MSGCPADIDHTKAKAYPISWAVDCPWGEVTILIEAEEDGEVLPENQFVQCQEDGCGCLIEITTED